MGHTAASWARRRSRSRSAAPPRMSPLPRREMGRRAAVITKVGDDPFGRVRARKLQSCSVLRTRPVSIHPRCQHRSPSRHGSARGRHSCYVPVPDTPGQTLQTSKRSTATSSRRADLLWSTGAGSRQDPAASTSPGSAVDREADTHTSCSTSTIARLLARRGDREAAAAGSPRYSSVHRRRRSATARSVRSPSGPRVSPEAARRLRHRGSRVLAIVKMAATVCSSTPDAVARGQCLLTYVEVAAVSVQVTRSVGGLPTDSLSGLGNRSHRRVLQRRGRHGGVAG